MHQQRWYSYNKDLLHKLGRDFFQDYVYYFTNPTKNMTPTVTNVVVMLGQRRTCFLSPHPQLQTIQWVNIALRRFWHNHGSIATEGSLKSAPCPTRINGYNSIVYSIQYHRQHYTLQAFEQLGTLYMHHPDDKDYSVRPCHLVWGFDHVKENSRIH